MFQPYRSPYPHYLMPQFELPFLIVNFVRGDIVFHTSGLYGFQIILCNIILFYKPAVVQLFKIFLFLYLYNKPAVTYHIPCSPPNSIYLSQIKQIQAIKSLFPCNTFQYCPPIYIYVFQIFRPKFCLYCSFSSCVLLYPFVAFGEEYQLRRTRHEVSLRFTAYCCICVAVLHSIREVTSPSPFDKSS